MQEGPDCMVDGWVRRSTEKLLQELRCGACCMGAGICSGEGSLPV
jgi:hypothetical protein